MKVNLNLQDNNRQIRFSSLSKVGKNRVLSSLAKKDIYSVKEKLIIPERETIFAYINPYGSKNLSKMTYYCKHYIDYPKVRGKYIEEFCGAKAIFKDSLAPYTLPVVKFPKNTMHISNFKKPNGSIAITSSIEETISTDNLIQCSALSIVSKEKNVQTLLHCCPGMEAKENRVILDYLLAQYNGSAPEITIVPGCYEETDLTVSFLADNIRDILGKNFKINFANTAEGYENIILKDGKLACAKRGRRLLASEINPPDRIIFNNPFYRIENGIVKYIGDKLLTD